MARSQITDPLQVGHFHVLDVSLSIPQVLLPVFTFRSCTLPVLDVDVQAVKEGNYEYPRKYVKGASVSTVTMEQGVSLFNSDFYDWTVNAVLGLSPPKTIMIIQFSRMNADFNAKAIASKAQAFAGQVGGAKAGKVVGGIASGVRKAGAFAAAPVGLAMKFAGSELNGPLRIPGRAWILKQCRPKTYRPGTDLDAMSMEISISSLELEFEEFEEISLGI